MRRSLSHEGLKLFACITMLLDHYGAILAPWEISYRLIGRLSFPVFCFLLAEGAHHTRSPGKYALRLFVAALISELPFDYAFYGKVFWHYQNVMVTLLLGLLAILAVDRTRFVWLKPIVALPFILAAEKLNADYGMHGVLLMLLFGVTHSLPWKHWIQAVGMLLIFADMRSPVLLTLLGVDITLQMFGALAILPIALYSGKKQTHNKALQWGFYLFYPVHLLMLYYLR
jgi:hypothetical protein